MQDIPLSLRFILEQQCTDTCCCRVNKAKLVCPVPCLYIDVDHLLLGVAAASVTVATTAASRVSGRTAKQGKRKGSRPHTNDLHLQMLGDCSVTYVPPAKAAC